LQVKVLPISGADMAWWESMQKEQLGQVAKDKRSQQELMTAKQLQPDKQLRSFQPTVCALRAAVC